MEQVVLDLLADRAPASALAFIAHWGERRSVSWMDAARQADERAASGGHLPQIRGQLRFHLGEVALRDAAKLASVGSFPLATKPAGGFFTVARVGRFALVSVTVRDKTHTPRRSITRKLLAQPNEDLERQTKLALAGEASPRGATELAYLGCVVAIPATRDPTVPAELAIAVPNAALNDWVAFIPLPRASALLQERGGGPAGRPPGEGGTIPDKVLPTFRLPGTGKGAGEEGKGE